MISKRSWPLFVVIALVLMRVEGAEARSPYKMEGSTYTSSKVCAACHGQIYDRWKSSRHALSAENPIFKAAYLEAYKESAGGAKYLCLRCHAPTTIVTRDYELRKEITKEGVTCDFCHTVRKVDLNNSGNPFKIEPGLMKRSTLRRASSPAHQTEYSELHDSSLLCAACHEYRTPDGLPITSTYSEWKNSPYPAEGKQCQYCHFPPLEGNVVLPIIKEAKGKFINEHRLAHSTSDLKKAVKVEIAEVKRIRDRLRVLVKVTNAGSGHMVPTGLPSRKLVLQVDVKTQKNQKKRISEIRESRIYQKVLVSEDGKNLIRDSEIMLKRGRVTIAQDNRLAPRETRNEEFTFFVPSDLDLVVSAQIDYLYRPLVLGETEMRVEMARDEKLSPAF
ncbi:MAG: hypothetical protein HY998_08115 [candidate division NC10 bacterium]|nr:hypothetical protein [candidate division NC10 bacterium]